MQNLASRYVNLLILPVGCLILGILLALIDRKLTGLGGAIQATLAFMILYIGFAFINFHSLKHPAKTWLMTIAAGILLTITFYLNQLGQSNWATILPFIISSYLVVTWQNQSTRLWQPCQWLTFSIFVTLILWLVLLIAFSLLGPVTPWQTSLLFEPSLGYPITGLFIGVGLSLVYRPLPNLRRFITVLSRFFLPTSAFLIVIILVASLITPQPRYSPMLLDVVMFIFLISLNGSLNRQFKLPYHPHVNTVLKVVTWLSNIVPLLALYSISLRLHHPEFYLMGIQGWLAMLYSLMILIYSLFYSVILSQPQQLNYRRVHYYLAIVIFILTLIVGAFF